MPEFFAPALTSFWICSSAVTIAVTAQAGNLAREGDRCDNLDTGDEAHRLVAVNCRRPRRRATPVQLLFIMCSATAALSASGCL